MNNTENNDENNDESIRLIKIITEAGIASRRRCEEIIQNGRVRVNNKVIIDPAYRVNESDTVSYDREIIEREAKHYIALYKPKGVVSTTKYLPGGRRIITEFFKDIKERLFYAGRLDSESRGIMIITNDGKFANIITHPSYEIMKVYDITVTNKVDPTKILEVSHGVTIKNIHYSPFKFMILSKGRIQSKIRITINEGKNREIRKIFDFLGYKVIDLERISVGSVHKFNSGLGTLEAGHTRRLSDEEIAFFFNQKEKMDILIKERPKRVARIEPDKIHEKIKEKKVDRSKWAKAKPRKGNDIKKQEKSRLKKSDQNKKSKWAKDKPSKGNNIKKRGR